MAEVLVVAVLTMLCFIAGLAGGRRIAASAMSPVILLLLSIVGNHSEIASVPSGTAFFTTTGWVAGAFVFIFIQRGKSNPDSAHADREDEHTGVSGKESFTPR